MTQKRSLADLAAAFSNKTTSDAPSTATWKLFFPFWKAEVDTTSVVRFLPDADPENSLAFLVENLTHELYINGKREKVACLKMYGEACPICELSSRFYNKSLPEYNEELGQKYYRKKSYIGQCLVIETALEHDADQLVKLIEFGPQIFKNITAAFGSGDLEEPPYELKGGYNFRLRKTQTGSGQNSYTTSNFAPKQTDVADDVIESMQLFNLSDYRAPKVERPALEAMLVASQSGGSYSSNNGAPASSQTSAQAPAQTGTSEVVQTTQTNTASTGKLDVIAELRKRAAAAAKANAEAN